MAHTVCITGATSGIGRAYAELAAAAGHDLLVTGRREPQLKELAASLERTHGVHVEVWIGALATAAAADALAARLEATPELTVLIHNAGYGHRERFFDTDRTEIRTMGELHMQCAAVLVRSAVPGIRRSAHAGRTVPADRAARGPRGERAGADTDRAPGPLPPGVILVSSLAAFAPMPGPAMYTATKAFLVALGRAIQPELARDGLHSQVLCPGFTHTEFHDRLDWAADRRRDRGIVRWMTARDVAERSLRRYRRRSPHADPVYVPGGWNRLLRALVGIVPRRLYASIARRA